MFFSALMPCDGGDGGAHLILHEKRSEKETIAHKKRGWDVSDRSSQRVT